MRIREQLLIGLMLMLMSIGSLHAQSCQWRQEGTAGPGWYDGGGTACNNDSSQQNEPPVRWASRWGAIAINTQNGALGGSTGQQNRYDAKRVALARCGDDCKIDLTYHDQCVALASGKRYYASVSAATVEEASLLAMKACGKGGATDCIVTYSECSLPERIQ
jgi:hypothetical protein